MFAIKEQYRCVYIKAELSYNGEEICLVVSLNSCLCVLMGQSNHSLTAVHVANNDQTVSLLPEIAVEEPEEVRERSPSIAKNPPSRILSVLNLVRPFTLRQLKEFLGKNGNVIEEGFWINKIKSHCYVTYETVEEAETSRNAMHGKRWPSGNPKILTVDFALNDQMYKETEGKLGTEPSSIPLKNEEIKTRREEKDEKEKVNDREKHRERHHRDKETKENDTHRRREHEREKKDDGGKHREKKEAPAKLLDDLFRKTKSTPCIYWLPLTKEQIVEKEKDRQTRREERLNERNTEIAREQKEKEDRRKQREMETQQIQRPRERRSPPPPNRNRRFSNSPLATRPSDNAHRARRAIPPPHHRRRSGSSSSS